MSNPTKDWDRLGDRFYRKLQLYTSIFDAELELVNYHISGAPFSGAIALHRDDSKVYAFRGSETTKSTIDIYSCSGKPIATLNWDKGDIKALGWSEDETLVVICQDGTVRCYPDLSEEFTTFSLGHGAEEAGVISCRFWLTGFVALLGNNRLISVARYDEPRPKLLATPPSDPVATWAIIPPAYTLSRSVEVLLAIGQTINVVDSTDSEDRMLQNGPFRHISVSPNGRYIALYTDDGKVWVISSDFQDKLSEYTTGSKTVPKDMQWCGNDAVVLSWEDEVHVVGPNGAASKHFYDSWVHLIPDVDGIRILTNDTCEFLQRVPDVLEDIFKTGSSSPASVLLDAVEQLDKESPKADDDIQLVKPNIVDAIESCVSAAGHEYDTRWQKQLLKAASFGKTVLDIYDSDAFVDMCETVRLLNAIRFYQIGMPLSYEQYLRLTPERLIARLTARREYLLALRISEYLRLPSNQIYVHWASRKVKASSGNEEAVSKSIVEKIGSQRGISFEHIARAAFDEGRPRLATELLNHEPRAAKQVPLLLDMEEDDLALEKAIESGDTDLVLFVLLQLRKRLPLASFFRKINARPVATALVESTARDQDRDLLKDLYYQDDRRLDGANLLFSDALDQSSAQAQIDKLRPATKLLHDSKEYVVHARNMEDAARLIRLQETLDTKEPPATSTDESDAAAPSIPFASLSLHDTIKTLIKRGQQKQAERLIIDFKVPERTAWNLRLMALVAARDWSELKDVAAKNKKSPIGWEVYFNDILGAGNPSLAGSVFVAKCTALTARERMDMYVKCGMPVKAAEEALKAKDKESLEGLRDKVQGREAAEVERMWNTLSKGR